MAPSRVKSSTIHKRGGSVEMINMRSNARTVSIWPSLWKPVLVFTMILWLTLRWRNVMSREERTIKLEYVVKTSTAAGPDRQQQLAAAAAGGATAAQSIKINASSESTNLKEMQPAAAASSEVQLAAGTTLQGHSTAASAVDDQLDEGCTINCSKLHAGAAVVDQVHDDAIATTSSPTLDQAPHAMHTEDGSSKTLKEITDQAAPADIQMEEDGSANRSVKLEADTIGNEAGVDFTKSNSKLPAAAELLQTDDDTAKQGLTATHMEKDAGGEIDTKRSMLQAGVVAVHETLEHRDDTVIETTKLHASVQDLIQEIRAATMRANGGNAVKPLSEAAKKEWHDRNPCASREKMPSMYTRRKFAKDADPNPAWELVFREYRILHRTCTSRIQNMEFYFEEKNTSTGCKFMLCDPTAGSGLGNKILLLTSCFLYAVLTQRVFLVPASTFFGDIMCEPFEGSSWRLPDPHVLGLGSVGNSPFQSMDSFLTAAKDGGDNDHDHSKVSDMIYAVDLSDRMKFQPANRFYCPTEQSLLRNVTWVGLVGCQYIIPKLFTIPTFRPTLESLFPTRMVLTDILRSLMLPVDTIWRAIEDVDTEQPQPRPDRRVGVQIRYFPGDSESHSGLESRVKQCAFENGLLPQQQLQLVTAANTANSEFSSKRNQSQVETSSPSSVVAAAAATTTTTTTPPLRTQVFIASLYDSFEKSLTMDYLQNPPANGENVTIMQLSRKFEQGFTIEEDAQALVEIILLSFSDEIIVTPMSTFGGVAHAYGALVPWFARKMKWFHEKPEDEEEPTGVPCVRGQTIDTCQHLPQKAFECPHDPDYHGTSVVAVAPYFRDCLVEDTASGMQLITGISSSPAASTTTTTTTTTTNPTTLRL